MQEGAPETMVEPFPTEQRLHTDVLEKKYGPIHTDVIRHDNEIREVHLRDEQGISRTYALTFFPEVPNSTEIQSIDEEIRNGEPIGKAFRKHGFEVRKNVIDVFVLQLPEQLKKEFATTEQAAKARISEFYAKKENEDPVVYGTVLEVYTPDFRKAVIKEIDIDQINPTTKSFLQARVSIEEIWSRLPKASQKNEWGDMEETYMQAKRESCETIEQIHKTIRSYLTKER